MAAEVEAAPKPNPTKPTFVFKGLSYLYHIEECRVVPIGYDRQGVKYLEVVDVIANKQFFTGEITSLDEDIVVKDKYGIIRFCVHGWNGVGQLDSYVNVKKPIGIVKDHVFYDHNKVPIYMAQKTHLGALNCFGPPTYRISTVLGNHEIGYITPEPTSMHLKFDQHLDEGPKALLVAFSMQLALSKYMMLNLNLQRVKYVYKNREKAKARRESQKRKQAGDAQTPEKAGTTVVYQPVAVPVPVPQPVLVPMQAPPSEPASQKPQIVFVQSDSKPVPSAPPTEVKVIMPPPPPQPKQEIFPPPPPTIPLPPKSDGEPNLVLVSIRKTKVSDSRRSSMVDGADGQHVTLSSVARAIPDTGRPSLDQQQFVKRGSAAVTAQSKQRPSKPDTTEGKTPYSDYASTTSAVVQRHGNASEKHKADVKESRASTSNPEREPLNAPQPALSLKVDTPYSRNASNSSMKSKSSAAVLKKVKSVRSAKEMGKEGNPSTAQIQQVNSGVQQAVSSIRPSNASIQPNNSRLHATNATLEPIKSGNTGFVTANTSVEPIKSGHTEDFPANSPRPGNSVVQSLTSKSTESAAADDKLVKTTEL